MRYLFKTWHCTGLLSYYSIIISEKRSWNRAGFLTLTLQITQGVSKKHQNPTNEKLQAGRKCDFSSETLCTQLFIHVINDNSPDNRPPKQFLPVQSLSPSCRIFWVQIKMRSKKSPLSLPPLYYPSPASSKNPCGVSSSWRRSCAAMAFRTFFLEVSCTSPPINSSSSMK